RPEQEKHWGLPVQVCLEYAGGSASVSDMHDQSEEPTRLLSGESQVCVGCQPMESHAAKSNHVAGTARRTLVSVMPTKSHSRRLCRFFSSRTAFHTHLTRARGFVR